MNEPKPNPYLLPETFYHSSCIERPGFLWFKQRHHEPNDYGRLYVDGIVSSSIIHVRHYAPPDVLGNTEHYVALVCRHCGNPFVTKYDWAPGGLGSITWDNWREVSPKVADQLVLEAFAKYTEQQERERSMKELPQNAE